MNSPALPRLMLAVLPALVLASLVASTVWGPSGLITRLRLKGDLVKANSELAKIERENQRLLRQLDLMERDPITLERMVAEELAWGRPGSTLYVFDEARTGPFALSVDGKPPPDAPPADEELTFDPGAAPE